MDIKQKTITGVTWSAVERFSVQIVQFVVQIIIARLLFPADYGMISMLAIFMAIAQTFTDGGFANALIQKKDRTNIDYSTVFYFNISVGVLLSIIFFLCSGAISSFYNMPNLKPIIQVMSVNLIILSFQIIQKTILTIRIDFKTQAKASLIGVVIGGIIGIAMAYKGYGAWALVAQFTTINIIQTALYWFFIKWKPLRVFSRDSFKRLFSFGSKILAANLLQTIYLNLYTLVIGKKYSATTLGYYSRADQFAQFPSSNITGILWRVTYPLMSEIQDDNIKLKRIYREYIKLSAFIIFPLMMGFAAVAEPFILLILTKKWIGIVPILQIISFYYMLYPLNAISTNLMQVKGKGDLYLRLEIIKKIIGIGLLFISLPMGIYYVCSSLIVYALINLGINIYYTSKLIDFNINQQITDLIKIFIASIIMGGIVYTINLSSLSNIPKLGFGILIGGTTYTLLCYLFRIPELKTLIGIIKKDK